MIKQSETAAATVTTAAVAIHTQVTVPIFGQIKTFILFMWNIAV